MRITAPPARPDPALIAGLYAEIHRLGGDRRGGDGAPPLSLGIAAIDQTLPWGGLPRAALHEVIAADDSAAAAGFSAVVLARLAGGDGTVAWCRRRRERHGALLYGLGLAAFGIDPARLILVRTGSERELLWAMEEGLRSGALAAVAGELGAAAPIALRRLQLAAERHRVTALLLRPSALAEAASAAVTRWRVASAAGGPFARPRWRVTLTRCRSGVSGLAPAPTGRRPGTASPLSLPATWLLEWNDETGGLAVVAELRHRSPAASAIHRAAR